jgi:hypothetical protein
MASNANEQLAHYIFANEQLAQLYKSPILLIFSVAVLMALKYLIFSICNNKRFSGPFYKMS